MASNLVISILRQRCPRCRVGAMFHGWFAMHRHCPHCGMLFQREEGYFLGAMYVSYLLGTALVVSLYFLTTWLWPNLDNLMVNVGVTALLILCVPTIFQYSRVLWVYFDRSVCPSDTSAGVYEKLGR